MTGPRSRALEALVALSGETPASVAAETEFVTKAGVVRQTTLYLTDMEIDVANTTGVSFGGTKIFTFPEGRILVLGVTATVGSCIWIDGTLEIPQTAGGDFSIGTTKPTDGTLTGTDVDLLPSTSIDPLSAGITGAALAASAQFDGTTTAVPVWANLLIDDADVGDGASDKMGITGSVVITWVNLGDY